MGGKREDIMCPVCEEEKETFNITYWDMNVCIQNLDFINAQTKWHGWETKPN